MKAEEALKLIMDRRFVLDCPQIVLSPHKPTSSRKGYRGPGFITQNEDGNLTFKICSIEGSPIDDLERFFSVKPGEILDEEHYYSLLATDINGRQWEARWIDPNPNYGPAGCFVHGIIKELHHEENLPESGEGYFSEIYFPGEIRIPCNTTSEVEKVIDGEKRSWFGNMNIAKFGACGFEFELEQEKGWLAVRVKSESRKITSISIIRFSEALQFILARSLSWAVLEIISGQNIKITIRPLNKNDKKLIIGPPISLQQCLDKPDIIWTLFKKYLEYVIDYQKDSWHPIFWWLNKIIESQSSSIDVEALVRSVAIEGILKSEFSDLNDLDENLQSQIDKIKDIISKSDLEENFKKRLNGSLGSMFNLRPKDRLHILKSRGLINDAHIKEYGKLRDSSTHGDLVSEIHLQEFFNQCNSVLVLFYHLIFTAIGYKGPYTDYSTYGFPLKDFEGLN
jgi:hypothetical protein